MKLLAHYINVSGRWQLVQQAKALQSGKGGGRKKAGEVEVKEK